MEIDRVPFVNRLRRTMSSAEAWGFSVVGYLIWFTLAPSMQAEIGSASLLVWIPGAIVGILLNLQVQSLGEKYPDVSGGTQITSRDCSIVTLLFPATWRLPTTWGGFPFRPLMRSSSQS